MAERKFYWIKLKTDFMNSDAVDFLMSQKDGANYVVLYQMLCLMTAKTNGKLERRMNEIIIPYDVEKIQRDTRYFNIDTVRTALNLYTNLGLIYKDENGCLTIANYENLIGSERGSAERMRRLRSQRASQCDVLSDADVTKLLQKSDELSDADVTKLLQKSDELSDVDKDKEKEIDKDKDINRLFIDKNSKDIRSGSKEKPEPIEPEIIDIAEYGPEKELINYELNEDGETMVQHDLQTGRTAVADTLKKSKTKQADAVIDYLNLRTGSQYRHSESSRRHIIARLNDGFTMQDCMTVIDKKCIDWISDDKMAKYLRPETLFGSKFENYLSQPEKPTYENGGLPF